MKEYSPLRLPNQLFEETNKDISLKHGVSISDQAEK